MEIEYLLFNVIVIIGPLLASFDRRVRYVNKWSTSLAAILIVLPIYITWDSLVTGRHWFFNPSFTLGFRLLNLPIEEWLFFISVPFASLFIWEIITVFRAPVKPFHSVYSRIVAYIFLTLALFAFYHGKECTSLTLLSCSFVLIVDRALGTGIFRNGNLALFFLLITASISIFNGYLTARPVVTYAPQYQLGILIGSIPIEDYFYGYAHILLCTILFEKLKSLKK